MRRAIALGVAGALLAAACGGSDDGETAATDPPESVTTAAPEPADDPVTESTDEPAPESTTPPTTTPTTDPQPTTTEPSPTTTTEPPPPPVNAVGLVPLPGLQRNFRAEIVDDQGLVWSLYSGSGGIFVENIIGPLPEGCHGTGFYDPVTYDLIQIQDRPAEAYATRGAGGCDGVQFEIPPGVLDGDAVVINTDDLILFDFGELPGDPFDVSTQVLDPDGQNGIFRSADFELPKFENQLGDADLTHVIGADVLLEVTDGGTFIVIVPPPPEPGDCLDFQFCLHDRFGLDIADTEGNPGQVVVIGERSGLFTFVDDQGWQALIRIVNGCAVNDRFWLFATNAFDDVGFELTVTDTVGGESRSYTSPPGGPFEPITDTAAFATCP